MFSLLLRNLFFTILQPGVVVVLLPYLILRYTGRELLPSDLGATHFVGAGLMAAGAAVALTCILRFATEGKGTLSPLDPTKQLVARGLYKYSRNPMYLGAMLTLAGETLFWWSLALVIYAVVVFIAFNLFVLLHEEPRCRRDFGDAYTEYCQNVRRWF
ncbi:MAG: methyltransferase family protein [Pyrinomonadaceae bacterium]